jgi:hypothetical protein
VKIVQWQDAALFGVKPLEAIAAPGFRHGEEAGLIGTEHEDRRDLEGTARHRGMLGDRAVDGKRAEREAKYKARKKAVLF